MWQRDSSPKPVSKPADLLSEAPTIVSPIPAPPKRVEQAAEQVVMNLGKSVMIKGELSASEDLTLYGQMEGRVNVPDHTLTIGPDANIRAEITASSVVIMGAVIGNITVTKRIDVQSTGSIVGDLVTPRIAIADGGQVTGKVQMTGEQARGVRRSA